MNKLSDVLQPIMASPTPGALVALQGALLASEMEGEAVESALEIAGQFHSYLSELQSKITAKQYSELASRLDIGAVGTVALENIVATEKEEFWKRLLLGGLGETLMVAASRQYIKAWDAETSLVHTQAAWYLSEALWRASRQMQPNLSLEQRWEAIQGLLAPAYAAETPAPAKAVLLGRVFQMLLLTHLARLWPAIETGPK
ncbi:MAG: hypothetical protein JXM73_13140 [Anaerolineae bacterium]|nr:hypothetical protein [Anaerolineae bacterium]